MRDWERRKLDAEEYRQAVQRGERPPFSARAVFDGSNGVLTTAFYAELESRGPLGLIAQHLFRAVKTSTRAKAYRRGRGYKTASYEVKGWSLTCLCAALGEYDRGNWPPFSWGWRTDPTKPHTPHILYVDLPGHGQVSFHSTGRFTGPDYPNEWDGSGLSADRIIAFCDEILRLPCSSPESSRSETSPGVCAQPSA